MSILLSMAPEDSKCQIEEINAGRGLSRRLAELGFAKGALLEIKRSGSGALIVSLNKQKYALSKGIAMKITVNCL